MKRSQSRRGFIKGALAGLVGGLFTLRGAEPAQAISTGQSIQQINVTIREADPRLSEEDQARYDDLNERYGDDPGLTEEEDSERIALNDEAGGSRISVQCASLNRPSKLLSEPESDEAISSSYAFHSS